MKKKKAPTVRPLSDKEFVMQKARNLPIGSCYRTADLEENGLGHIIVIRNHPQGKYTVGMYLTDIYCRGVKDAMYHVRIDEDEKEELLDYLRESIGLEEIPYVEAHNWIYGAVAFAEEAGIAPSKEFAVARYILEEDTDDVPLIEFEFGYKGKHFLWAKDRLELNTYLPLLQKNLKKDQYQFAVGEWEDMEDDEKDWDEDIEDEEWDEEDEEWDEEDEEEWDEEDREEDEEDWEDPWAVRPQTHRFQFKVQLRGLQHPTVWRRFTVPARMTFSELHEMIQTAFDWLDYHLWQFSPTGWGSHPVIGERNSIEHADKEATEYFLDEYFQMEGQKLVYIYDFGDDWTLDIVLEKITDDTTTDCIMLDARGASPFEDCGGVPGYLNYIEEKGLTEEDLADANWTKGDRM